MPEVQEVFRLATNKVKPEPDALERQLRRQRSAARTNRVRAYIAVAAVMLLVIVGAVVILNAVDGNRRIAVDDGSGEPEQLTFRTSLPAGAVEQSLQIVDLQGERSGTVPGLPLDGFAPSLSTNGTIAFVAAPPELGYNQIGVMGARGVDAHVVPTPGIIVNTVAISPDATKIAFEGLEDGNGDIYVVGVDGSGLTRLTDDPATDQFPQWSPDGETIVYDNAGTREIEDAQFSKTAEVWSVPSDGGGAPTRLTHGGYESSAPSFSPDGRQIAYFHGGQIWVMDADGGEPRVLVSGGRSAAFTPRWSPNGEKIAFSYFHEAYRPMVQLGQDFRDMPLVIVAVVDVDSGSVVKLTSVAMATDLNTPQWVDEQHLLVLRVPAKDPG